MGRTRRVAAIKVAIIDSGIYVTRDRFGHYAGNPCFNAAGYLRPKGGFPKGDTRFTNNKVIVARAYFRPNDPPTPGNDTPLPGPDSSPHGTHVAGTVACNPGTDATIQGVDVELSGVAPRAYLMNYRVFYPSSSTEDFQNGNAYTVELVQAIEDAVADGADIISNSWGSTLPEHAGVARSDGAGRGSGRRRRRGDGVRPGQQRPGSWQPATRRRTRRRSSPSGRSTKNVTIVPGVIDVTAPTPVPPALTGIPVGPAGFGEEVNDDIRAGPGDPGRSGERREHARLRAVPRRLARRCDRRDRSGARASSAPRCSTPRMPARVAALVYNSAAGGDNLQSMGAGVDAPRRDDPVVVHAALAGPRACVAYYDRQPGRWWRRSSPSIRRSPRTSATSIAAFSSSGPRRTRR